MAPVFSHGDLRLYLLSLLDEGPRHGYDIMQALSDRTGGTYTPSAGTIYPRLAKLEEEGLVTKTVDGRKTVYEITDAGRAEVAARAGDLEGIEAGLTDSVRLIADEVRGSVREAMKSLRADLAAATRDERATANQTPTGDDPRTASREQVHRADAAMNEFRAQVRTDLRSHVARGGELAASVVDDLANGARRHRPRHHARAARLTRPLVAETPTARRDRGFTHGLDVQSAFQATGQARADAGSARARSPRRPARARPAGSRGSAAAAGARGARRPSR